VDEENTITNIVKEDVIMENQFKDVSSSSGAGARDEAARLKKQVGDKAAQAKDAAVDFGRKTVEHIDAQRVPAAGALDETASTLDEQVDRVAASARATADKLHATADYVRNQDIKAMAKDVEGLVRRYPGPAVAIAAAVGFVTARILQTRD
jgi:ElaB/YqjD/DUF883 family membrane-anchored ribosome-binding protein